MVTRVEVTPEMTTADAPVVEEVKSDRPEWLPEKFNSPEDMAKAYGELETKIGSPEAQPVEENKVNEEAPKEEAPEADVAKDTVDSMGLDFDALSNEYASNGELSEDAYKSLEGKGITKDVVDAFIKGQESLAKTQSNDVVATVGGEDKYNDMIMWAKDNMSTEDVKSYNDIVNGNNMGNIRLAVQGLKAQYDNANPNEPNLTAGKPSGQSSAGYRSWNEVKTDMSDPKYAVDPAYRQDVQNKLANSNL